MQTKSLEADGPRLAAAYSLLSRLSPRHRRVPTRCPLVQSNMVEGPLHQFHQLRKRRICIFRRPLEDHLVVDLEYNAATSLSIPLSSNRRITNSEHGHRRRHPPRGALNRRVDRRARAAPLQRSVSFLQVRQPSTSTHQRRRI